VIFSSVTKFSPDKRSTKFGSFADAYRRNPKEIFYVGKRFHPDRFFGQEIGHYKDKIEAIFGRSRGL